MPSLYFQETGEGSPIIFIHGFCETHKIWNGFADRFAQNHRVIAIDLPGFGESKLPTSAFSIDDIAIQLGKFLQERSIEQYTLIGHSLGGYVSLALAQMFPKEYRSIILFHSTPLEDGPEKKANRNRVYEFVAMNGVAPFVDTFVPGLFFNKQHPAIPVVHQIALKTGKETILSYTQAMRDRPSRLPFLTTFKKPILLIGGEFDPIISPDSLSEIGRSINATNVFLPETAHMGMVETPDIAWSAIDIFLKKLG